MIVKITVCPFGVGDGDQLMSAAVSSCSDSVFKCFLSQNTGVLVLFFHVAVWPVLVGDGDQLMSAAVSSGPGSVFLELERTVSWR